MSTQIATKAHLSWSQVNSYTQCPAKWWLSRHYPMELTPAALKFGQAIHEALASFYLAKAEGCTLGADELLATYEAIWSRPSEAELKFNHGEDDQTMREMAYRMLAAFLEVVSPGEVLAVEQGFSVEIAEGLLISGFVDLVEIKEGRFWIVDFKTAKGEPSAAFDTEQVGFYRIGLQELGLVPAGAEVGLRYDVLRKLKTKGEFVSVEVVVTDKDLTDLRHKLTQVWQAMDAPILYRVKGWSCQQCSWANACREVDLSYQRAAG